MEAPDGSDGPAGSVGAGIEVKGVVTSHTVFTSRAAAESNSTVGSSYSLEEEEDVCLLNLGYFDIYAILNLKTYSIVMAINFH